MSAGGGSRLLKNLGGIKGLFKSFSGDCGRRVGSKDCGAPAPIETVNGIGADCDGVLTLQFKGCGLIGRNITDCGIIIDCDLGLSGSCAPPPAFL